MKMTVAQYVMKFLEERGVKHAFQVTGGGAMFLNDAVEQSKIEPVFCHHEQACAMAATAYSKLHNDVPLVVPTSGCGSTNAITGILDAWQDSNSVFVVSGQCNVEHIPVYGVRKFGIQAVDIITMVRGITKYSVTVTNPLEIKQILTNAWRECTTGRRGPVWVDIPLNIQNKEIDEETLFTKMIDTERKEQKSHSSIDVLNTYLEKSKRPIVLAGNGIHLSNTAKKFERFLSYHGLPAVFTFLGTDLLDENHELNIGRVGTKGTRAGNFAIANSDLIIVLGASLNIAQTGFQTHLFAREAKKVVIDIDDMYLHQTAVDIDEYIKMDLKDFFGNGYTYIIEEFYTDAEWRKRCLSWKNKWSVFDRPDINDLNMYSFTKLLSSKTTRGDYVTITDAGSANYLMCQAMSNTRLILPGAQGEMGFGIPAITGAWFADKSKKVLCVTGEGSLQFNMQELETIRYHKIPAKIFVFENGGYLSIRNTQTKFFEKRFSGIDESSGVSFPDADDIARTYGLKCFHMYDIDETMMDEILSLDKAVLCYVHCPEEEQIYPSNATQQMENGQLVSQPLENMYPFLSKEEYEREMIIPIYRGEKND